MPYRSQAEPWLQTFGHLQVCRVWEGAPVLPVVSYLAALVVPMFAPSCNQVWEEALAERWMSEHGLPSRTTRRTRQKEV